MLNNQQIKALNQVKEGIKQNYGATNINICDDLGAGKSTILAIIAGKENHTIKGTNGKEYKYKEIQKLILDEKDANVKCLNFDFSCLYNDQKILKKENEINYALNNFFNQINNIYNGNIIISYDEFHKIPSYIKDYIEKTTDKIARQKNIKIFNLFASATPYPSHIISQKLTHDEKGINKLPYKNIINKTKKLIKKLESSQHNQSTDYSNYGLQNTSYLLNSKKHHFIVNNHFDSFKEIIFDKERNNNTTKLSDYLSYNYKKLGLDNIQGIVIIDVKGIDGGKNYDGYLVYIDGVLKLRTNNFLENYIYDKQSLIDSFYNNKQYKDEKITFYCCNEGADFGITGQDATNTKLTMILSDDDLIASPSELQQKLVQNFGRPRTDVEEVEFKKSNNGTIIDLIQNEKNLISKSLRDANNLLDLQANNTTINTLPQKDVNQIITDILLKYNNNDKFSQQNPQSDYLITSTAYLTKFLPILKQEIENQDYQLLKLNDIIAFDNNHNLDIIRDSFIIASLMNKYPTISNNFIEEVKHLGYKINEEKYNSGKYANEERLYSSSNIVTAIQYEKIPALINFTQNEIDVKFSQKGVTTGQESSSSNNISNNLSSTQNKILPQQQYQQYQSFYEYNNLLLQYQNFKKESDPNSSNPSLKTYNLQDTYGYKPQSNSPSGDDSLYSFVQKSSSEKINETIDKNNNIINNYQQKQQRHNNQYNYPNTTQQSLNNINYNGSSQKPDIGNNSFGRSYTNQPNQIQLTQQQYQENRQLSVKLMEVVKAQELNKGILEKIFEALEKLPNITIVGSQNTVNLNINIQNVINKDEVIKDIDNILDSRKTPGPKKSADYVEDFNNILNDLGKSNIDKDSNTINLKLNNISNINPNKISDSSSNISDDTRKFLKQIIGNYELSKTVSSASSQEEIARLQAENSQLKAEKASEIKIEAQKKEEMINILYNSYNKDYDDAKAEIEKDCEGIKEILYTVMQEITKKDFDTYIAEKIANHKKSYPDLSDFQIKIKSYLYAAGSIKKNTENAKFKEILKVQQKTQLIDLIKSLSDKETQYSHLLDFRKNLENAIKTISHTNINNQNNQPITQELIKNFVNQQILTQNGNNSHSYNNSTYNNNYSVNSNNIQQNNNLLQLLCNQVGKSSFTSHNILQSLFNLANLMQNIPNGIEYSSKIINYPPTKALIETVGKSDKIQDMIWKDQFSSYHFGKNFHPDIRDKMVSLSIPSSLNITNPTINKTQISQQHQSSFKI